MSIQKGHTKNVSFWEPGTGALPGSRRRSLWARAPCGWMEPFAMKRGTCWRPARMTRSSSAYVNCSSVRLEPITSRAVLTCCGVRGSLYSTLPFRSTLVMVYCATGTLSSITSSTMRLTCPTAAQWSSMDTTDGKLGENLARGVVGVASLDDVLEGVVDEVADEGGATLLDTLNALLMRRSCLASGNRHQASGWAATL